jgi:hypothetical protein
LHYLIKKEAISRKILSICAMTNTISGEIIKLLILFSWILST